MSSYFRKIGFVWQWERNVNLTLPPSSELSGPRARQRGLVRRLTEDTAMPGNGEEEFT